MKPVIAQIEQLHSSAETGGLGSLAENRTPPQ